MSCSFRARTAESRSSSGRSLYTPKQRVILPHVFICTYVIQNTYSPTYICNHRYMDRVMHLSMYAEREKMREGSTKSNVLHGYRANRRHNPRALEAYGFQLSNSMKLFATRKTNGSLVSLITSLTSSSMPT